MRSIARGRTRRTPLLLALAAALTVVGAGAGPVAARSSGPACPAARSLVPKAHWKLHHLAKGVWLAEGKAHDGRGVVDMHVLRVRLATPGVQVKPLMRSVARRTALSRLAAGHRHLVAATNTGYFDFYTGAPTAPVIASGRPLTISAAHQSVIGLGTNGRVQHGKVSLAGAVRAGEKTLALAGVNLPQAARGGITAYTRSWGSFELDLPWNADTIVVRNGHAATAPGWHLHVPSDATTLVARGPAARAWLDGLHRGDAVSVHLAVRSNTRVPFTQAYGVGVSLVQQRGVARRDLGCRASDPQPARTAVGYADGGRVLVLAMVTDHRGHSHGLDQNQMSRLMVQLGVDRAYSFDGSGSTELLAKLPHHKLRLRTYPADGVERPMPVGLGIFVRH